MSWNVGELVSYPVNKSHKGFVWARGRRAPEIVKFVKSLDNVPYHQYLDSDGNWFFCVLEHTVVRHVVCCRQCGEFQFNTIRCCRVCRGIIIPHDLLLHAYNGSNLTYTKMMTRTFGGDFFVSPRRETRVNNCLSRTNTLLSGGE